MDSDSQWALDPSHNRPDQEGEDERLRMLIYFSNMTRLAQKLQQERVHRQVGAPVSRLSYGELTQMQRETRQD